MLVRVDYFLQLTLHAALYAACSAAFVFSLVGTQSDQFAFLLELHDSAHSVINLSLLSAFLLAPYVLATTTWGMYKALLCYKKLELHGNFYAKATLALAHVMALAGWLLFVAFQPQIYRNGHVPVLDALFRDYDRQSLCWHNVVLMPYEVHDFNAINDHRSCVYLDNFMKKCVLCRLEIRQDEPTVFNQIQGALTLWALTAVVLHCWNMRVQWRAMRRKQRAGPVETEGYDTAEEEEERQSNVRLLQIVSEARLQFERAPMDALVWTDALDARRPSADPRSPRRASSPASSPDSGIGRGHAGAIYDVPDPVKALVPVPPPLPPAPNVARRPASSPFGRFMS